MFIFTLVWGSIGSSRHANAYFAYGSVEMACVLSLTLAGLYVYFWCLGVVFWKIVGFLLIYMDPSCLL